MSMIKIKNTFSYDIISTCIPLNIFIVCKRTFTSYYKYNCTFSGDSSFVGYVDPVFLHSRDQLGYIV